MERAGYRALLAVPLLREGRIVGGLIVRRRVTRPLPDGAGGAPRTASPTSRCWRSRTRGCSRELEDKSRQLEIASRHKSQFLANMSHELRTPLNAILGYTELIQDGIYGPVPERIREVLERVEASGRHLLGLINAVLDVSKIEAGRLTLVAPGRTRSRTSCRRSCAAVEPLAAEKGLALRWRSRPDLPRGRGDERRITRCSLNLLGNAIKFTDAGEVARCRRDGRRRTRSWFPSPTPDRGSPRPTREASSRSSSRRTTPRGRRAAPGSAWPSPSASSSFHGGRVWVESARRAAARLRLHAAGQVERQVDAVDVPKPRRASSWSKTRKTTGASCATCSRAPATTCSRRTRARRVSRWPRR